MRYAHAVSDVRAAERALMARVPDGALMQRAAAGLAAVCASLLDRVYGSRVVVLAGTGDNGGDALFAGAAAGRPRRQGHGDRDRARPARGRRGRVAALRRQVRGRDGGNRQARQSRQPT